MPPRGRRGLENSYAAANGARGGYGARPRKNARGKGNGDDDEDITRIGGRMGELARANARAKAAAVAAPTPTTTAVAAATSVTTMTKEKACDGERVRGVKVVYSPGGRSSLVAVTEDDDAASTPAVAAATARSTTVEHRKDDAASASAAAAQKTPANQKRSAASSFSNGFQRRAAVPPRPIEDLNAHRQGSQLWRAGSLSVDSQRELGVRLCDELKKFNHGVTYEANMTQLLKSVFSASDNISPPSVLEFSTWLLRQPIFSVDLVGATDIHSFLQKAACDPSVCWWTNDSFTAPLDGNMLSWLSTDWNLLTIASKVLRSSDEDVLTACAQALQRGGPTALSRSSFLGRLVHARQIYLWLLYPTWESEAKGRIVYPYVGETISPLGRAHQHGEALFKPTAAPSKRQRGHEIAVAQMNNDDNNLFGDDMYQTWRALRDHACECGMWVHLSIGQLTRETYEIVGSSYAKWIKNRFNRDPEVLEVSRVLGAVGFFREMCDTVLLNSLHHHEHNPRGLNHSQPGLRSTSWQSNATSPVDKLQVLDRLMASYVSAREELRDRVKTDVENGVDERVAQRRAVVYWMRSHTVFDAPDGHTVHGDALVEDYNKMVSHSKIGKQVTKQEAVMNVQILKRDGSPAKEYEFRGVWTECNPIKAAVRYRKIRFQNKEEREKLRALATEPQFANFIEELGYKQIFDVQGGSYLLPEFSVRDPLMYEEKGGSYERLSKSCHKLFVINALCEAASGEDALLRITFTYPHDGASEIDTPPSFAERLKELIEQNQINEHDDVETSQGGKGDETNSEQQ